MNFKGFTFVLLLTALFFAVQLHAQESVDWRLEITPTAGASRGTTVTIGQHADALNEVDRFDAPILALVPAVVAYFDHAGWMGSDDNYWYDFRPFGAERLWVLTTSSNRVGDTFTLDWNAADLPSGLDFILEDKSNGITVDMTSLVSYSFPIVDVGIHFLIIKVFNDSLDECPDEDAAGLDPDGNGCIDGLRGPNLLVTINELKNRVDIDKGELTYRITVHNNGGLVADNVLVDMAGFANAEQLISSTKPCVVREQSAVLSCDVGAVPINGSTVMEVIVSNLAIATNKSQLSAVLITSLSINAASQKPEDSACFIATAAYGSYMEPQVRVLREFRDQTLLPTVWGRWLVRVYYQISPPLADVIAQSDGLRSVARVLLTPLVYVVQYPLIGLLLASGLLLLFMRLWFNRRSWPAV